PRLGTREDDPDREHRRRHEEQDERHGAQVRRGGGRYDCLAETQYSCLPRYALLLQLEKVGPIEAGGGAGRVMALLREKQYDLSRLKQHQPRKGNADGGCDAGGGA
ncbi:hypothetical protein THAOC_12611, partial [Thalassiosira oceanica]